MQSLLLVSKSYLASHSSASKYCWLWSLNIVLTSWQLKFPEFKLIFVSMELCWSLIIFYMYAIWSKWLGRFKRIPSEKRVLRISSFEMRNRCGRNMQCFPALKQEGFKWIKFLFCRGRRHFRARGIWRILAIVLNWPTITPSLDTTVASSYCFYFFLSLNPFSTQRTKCSFKNII